MVEGSFSIKVDEKLWFYEPDFSICEFLMFLEKWLNNPDKRANMYYNTMETEDNPLISFVRKGEEWYIRSYWQLFDCSIAFTRLMLEDAIHTFKRECFQEAVSHEVYDSRE